MIKTACCQILECGNCDNNLNCHCNNVNICDQKIELCVNNGNMIITLSISKHILNNLMSHIKCDMDCNDYKIISAILISKYIYIFIQTGYKTKKNSLHVIHCTVDVDKKEIIVSTIKLQMSYNIYNIARYEHISSEKSFKLKVEQVVYNKYSDMFIVLFNLRDKTLIGKIDNLESIFSIGTSLDLIHTHQHCELFIIEKKPKCIIPIDKYKYKIIVYDHHTKCNKSYTICID
jgi:hypothetical protein